MTVSESKEGKHISTYSTGLESKIHSVSMSSDTENFINADESCINMWNLERSSKNPVYNLVNYANFDNLESSRDEVITSAKFNKDQGPMFLYTT